MSDPSINVTLLLKRHTDGDPNALSELIPLLYKELQHLASSYLRRERTDHTLQTTALVHEAYLRLVDQKEVTWNNRAHFFAVAAQMMRRILVDYARKHKALKRGSSAPTISLEQAAVFSKEQTHEMLIVDELLTRLASFDPQGGRIVELRFYGGLSVEETAEVMSISSSKVKREWSVAKAWLIREMAKHSTQELPRPLPPR
jgi:RNA polymerase sigma factor (TIGR02999 family)